MAVPSLQRSLTTLVAGIALGAAAQAQSFDYPDFSSVAGLAMNGGAAQSGSVLRLTQDIGGLAASSYYDTPVSVVGGFDCVFEFQITHAGQGADGMTFVIHNDVNGSLAVGECCSPMGYSQFTTSAAGTAMENGLVVEIDTYNAGNGDISGNSVSVHTSGSAPLDFDESASLAQVSAGGINMSDGTVHAMRVQHDGSLLNVYLDDLATPILSVAYSFVTGGTYTGGGAVGGLNLIGGTSAYVGFTAATGGLSEIHDIISWSWNTSNLGTNYCLSVTNSTGAPAGISANGSDSVAANDVVLSATPVPDQPGIFYYGPNQIQQAFGNGFGCVGGVLGRLDVSNATGGVLTFALDNTNPPNGATQITAGSTWNFQAWFRDPAAGGAFFNLSDGLEIVFTP